MAKIITAFVHEQLARVQKEEISFSRFVELLNEKANEETKPNNEKEQDLLLLYVEKELIKDQIIHCSSRLIKDIDSQPERGMIEVSNRYIEQLNELMHNLDKIDNKISDVKIHS
jgi:hypothetical protein